MNKTIMVDMDNVITDGSFKKYIEEFYGINVNLDEIKEYTYVQELTKEKTKEFWEYVSDKSFYDDALLLEGCLKVLEDLNEKYEVYIVTSYLWNETIDLSGRNLSDKYYYLRKEIPFIKPEKYIFATNKNIMNFDIRIDDKIENLAGADVKLLFTAWHNKDISEEELENKNIIRVNNWKEIGEILLK